MQDGVASSKGEGSATADVHSLEGVKFTNPNVTAEGEPRAVVPFRGYETVWFNTGTLCNLTCQNCYIEFLPQ